MSQIKKVLFVSLLVGFLSSLSSFAQGTVAPTVPPLSNFLWGNTSVNAVGKTYFVSGTGFGYRYILPKNFNPNVRYPAVIFLCGVGEDGTDNNAQLAVSNNTGHGVLDLVSTANPDNQSNYPLFLIAPQTTTADGWSTDSAATQIQNLINIFKTQYPNAFDTTRLYLTGLSDGGYGTYDIPYLLSQSNHLGYNPFAAIVPLSGQLTRSVSTEPEVPIWVFHGADDVNVPIASSDDVTVPEMRAAGWSVIYSRYTTGTHDIWEVAYQHPELLPWLYSQQQGEADQPLSDFTVSGATEASSGAYATVFGTAANGSPAFNGISWSNAATGQSGTGPSSLAPTWSLPGIPLAQGANSLQLTAQAPNNTGIDSGVLTNYGGNLTVNLPYSVTPTSGGSANLALNKPVTVSSVETASLGGSNAVDGNNSTRWSSLYSDPQWIVVDLGSSYDIREIDLNWETACGKNYLLQTSPDNVNWTTQTTVTGNTTPGLHVYTYMTPPTARYVRMYGTARATSYGYSIYEFSVYGTASTTTPPPPPPPQETDVALNCPVTVSSVDSAGNAGANAVDGNTTTRWSSAYSDPQWIVVDLGSDYAISEIDLDWETACGKNYQIQTSTDDVNWSVQTNVTGNTATGLLQYPYANPPTARYVRMYGTARATSWGYSLYELYVYGTSTSTPTPATKLSLNQPVTVSSVDSPGNAGSNAVDADLTTRWSSAYSDPQWIVVDLGTNHQISEVDLTWETACGKDYLIQTSTDDVNWTTQTTVTGNTSTGLLTYTYATPPTARYVRMYGTARATAWGYSLYDFSVYGQ
jgi:poly(3-hydroxybutyrate) depolymerase